MIRLSAFILAALFLSACSTQRFEADVVRFHQFDQGVTGIGGERRITVQPVRPDLNGLAFATYADLIGQKLMSYGFKPASTVEDADMIALVDYSATSRPRLDDQRDSPVSVGVGVGGVGRHVGVSVGTVFGVGGNRKEDTIYARSLSLQLKDVAQDQIVFEGRVTSLGEEGNLPLILPNMIDAMFDDFPGPDGATTHFEKDISQE